MTAWSWKSPMYPGVKSKDATVSSFSYDDTFKLKRRRPVPLKQMTASQAGILVSGLLVLCCWRFLSERLAVERHGYQALLEIWSLLVTSLFLGKVICRVLSCKVLGVLFTAPQPELAHDILSCSDVGGAESSTSCSKDNTQHDASIRDDAIHQDTPAQGHIKKPLKYSKSPDSDVLLGKVPILQPRQRDDDSKAEPEAATKVAAQPQPEPAPQPVQPLLKKLRRGSNLSDVSQTVFELVELLLSSRHNVSDFVQLGGIRALLAIIPKLNHELQLHCSTTPVLQATMQITWALMAVANESCAVAAEGDEAGDVLGSVRARMLDDGAVMMLGPLLKAVLANSEDMQQAQQLQPVLRNLCVLLLKLCDSSAQQQDQDPQSAAAAQAMQAMGLLPALLELYNGAHSIEPAIWAAASLAVICQRRLLDSEATDALLDSMLAAGNVRSLCAVLWELHAQQHLPMLQRCREVLHSFVHFVLDHKFDIFFECVLTEHLGGCLLGCLPRSLARHCLLNMLSTRGQEIMAAVEAEWECDVPLLLAQLLPMDVHMMLPAPAAAGADAQQLPPTYTDQQVCRMLLVRRQLSLADSRVQEAVSRLEELVLAFFDELQQEEDEGGDDGGAMQSDVVLAVHALVDFLMGQDLDLQQVRQQQGAAMELSTTSGGSHSSIETALQSEHSARYAHVLGDAVAQQQMDSETSPANGEAQQQQSSSSTRTTVIPDPEASSSALVAFDFGGHVVLLSKRCYRLLKDASSMIGSILKRADSGQPITLLRIPRFLPDANAWVLQCAVAWLTDRASLALSAADALKLWPAADYLQLESLQAHCEDVIAQHFSSDASTLEQALELCSWHLESSARLVHLVTTHMMRSMGGMLACGALRRVSVCYRRQFAVCFFEEVRDRLVAFLALNAGAVGEPEVTAEMA